MGEKVKAGAHLIKLIRTQAGKFRVETSVKLDEIDVSKNLINPLEMLDLEKVEVQQQELEKYVTDNFFKIKT